MKCDLLIVALALSFGFIACADEEVDPETLGVMDDSEMPTEDIPVDPEKLEYAKGSVCGYCSYCQFCTLCDQDCPCETSPAKPNCKLCKYCKYCNLCSAVCDTVCTPGGILDRMTGVIVNSLPTVNHDEVNQDIETVRHYISGKDEL